MERNLQGLDLRKETLRGANLSGANLTGINVRDSLLNDADIGVQT